MLISPTFPLPPPDGPTVFLPFLGLACLLPDATSWPCPFPLALPVDEAELTGRLGFEGMRFGGGIANDAEDAVLDTTDGCLMPDVVDVGLRDIVCMRVWVE